jgi:hypothetical protein
MMHPVEALKDEMRESRLHIGCVVLNVHPCTASCRASDGGPHRELAQVRVLDLPLFRPYRIIKRVKT